MRANRSHMDAAAFASLDRLVGRADGSATPVLLDLIESTTETTLLRDLVARTRAWAAASTSASDQSALEALHGLALLKAGRPRNALEIVSVLRHVPETGSLTEALAWQTFVHAMVDLGRVDDLAAQLDLLEDVADRTRPPHDVRVGYALVDAHEAVAGSGHRLYAALVSLELALRPQGGDRHLTVLRRLVDIARSLGDFERAFEAQGRLLEAVERKQWQRTHGSRNMPREAVADRGPPRDDATAADRVDMAREMARMSHEVRTPLHGVIASADLLLRSDLDVNQRDLAEAVRASSELALGVINTILDLSGIESGQVTLTLTPCDLVEEVRRAVLVVRERAHAAGLAVHAVVEAGCPAVLRTDSVRLRQVLVNLLGNAVKFTEEGAIGIRAYADGDHVSLDVWDTGAGIASDEIPRLFERFYQGRARSEVRGTGLGLPISLELARRLGGTMTVRSELGSGSTFRVRLPIDAHAPRLRAEVQPLLVSQVEAPAPVAAAASGRRILAAEDNVLNAKVVGRMLGVLGWDAEVVSDGEQAVAAAMRGDFEVVLMDCNMPKLDGLEASRQLRMQGYRGCIVAFTADAVGDVRRRCEEAGMDSVLTKPARLEDLRAALPAPPAS
jgi:signal transduction histidine kinase